MSSQTVTVVELTVVELINPQMLTQLELLLWMMDEEQDAHWYAAGEPSEEVVMPHGRSQLSLHWFTVPFSQKML